MISLVVDFAKKDKKESLWKILRTLKERKYAIEIKQYREGRSNPQNRYYWGVVLSLLSNHTGFTPEEMHETLKQKFLFTFKPLPTGEEIKIPGSTADLDTAQFEEYLEHVKRFAIQELDVLIPDPNSEI
jgi:hypothetical protein